MNFTVFLTVMSGVLTYVVGQLLLKLVRVYRATEKIYEQNASDVENICDSLSIYLPDDERISKVPVTPSK